MDHRRFRPSAFALWLAAAAALLPAGCGGMFAGKSTSRDFNELIPRMMNAIQSRAPEDAAANLFNVTSPDERRDAIAYLEVKKYGHDEPYMKAYELLTTDKHPMVRAQAMRALGSSRQPAAADYLIKALDPTKGDMDVQVRRDAAQGLVTTWNEKAEAPVAFRLKEDADDQVRIFCAMALAHATTPEGIRVLIDSLSDQNAAIVRYAHNSLAASAHQDFGYDTKAWLRWYQETHVAAPGSAPAPLVPATNR
jgi:HEAT repeat protein